MPSFQVPLKVQVPATGTVEIEAESFSEACSKVQADIDDQGFESRAAEAEFTTDWLNQHDLAVDQTKFDTRAV